MFGWFKNEKPAETPVPIFAPPGYRIAYAQAPEFSQGSRDYGFASGGWPVVPRDGGGQQQHGFLKIHQGGMLNEFATRLAFMPTTTGIARMKPLVIDKAVAGGANDPRRGNNV